MAETKAKTKPRRKGQANGSKPQEQKAPNLPVKTLREALPYLRQPFAPEAVGFKPQSQGDQQTLCVAYIDARLVIERLNLVLGENWTADFEKAEEVGPRAMWCHLTVDGVTRSDVGEGTGKALVSDSLKRAAVHFGIGRSLYASPAMFVKTADLVGRGKAKYLSEKQREELRGKYTDWLEKEGIPAFGPVLQHGDAATGSLGMAIDPEGHPAEEEGPAAASQDRKLPADAAERLQKTIDEKGLSKHLDAKLRSFGAKALTDLTIEQSIKVYEWTGAGAGAS